MFCDLLSDMCVLWRAVACVVSSYELEFCVRPESGLGYNTPLSASVSGI